MQGKETGRKFGKGFGELIIKIGRLRRKLLSHGWSAEQTIRIILFQFLKLPQIDWKKTEETSKFYELKERYRLDAGTTQLLMCIQQIVPNFHAIDVCEYLLSVLVYNSIEFGFDLDDSSSDSNDSPSLFHGKLKTRTKFRLKRRKSEKRNLTIINPKKKVKKQAEEQKLSEKSNQQKIKKMMEFHGPAFKNFEELSENENFEKRYLKREESDCE